MISKQKIYEKSILLTYEYQCCPQAKSEMLVLKKVPKTLSELIIKRSLFGFQDNISLKHPFDKMGVKYVYQLCGMAMDIENDEYTSMLFDFMNTHKYLFDFHDEEQAEDFYMFFYASLGKYLEYSKKMADFLLENFDHRFKVFTDTFKIAYATGTTNLNLGKLIEIKKEIQNKD